jgi:hypothetical protein
MTPNDPPPFAEQAGRETNPSLIREFLEFLRDNKKWWLMPILLVVLFLGLMVVLTGTPAGPFIYSLF